MRRLILLVSAVLAISLCLSAQGPLTVQTKLVSQDPCQRIDSANAIMSFEAEVTVTNNSAEVIHIGPDFQLLSLAGQNLYSPGKFDIYFESFPTWPIATSKNKQIKLEKGQAHSFRMESTIPVSKKKGHGLRPGRAILFMRIVPRRLELQPHKNSSNQDSSYRHVFTADVTIVIPKKCEGQAFIIRGSDALK